MPQKGPDRVTYPAIGCVLSGAVTSPRKNADGELTVRESRLHALAKTGGQLDLSLVTAVLPLMHEEVTRAGTAKGAPRTAVSRAAPR